MGFVQELMYHTRLYESPGSFWKWSAYAAIAGILRDSVWLVDGDSRLYPNMYVLFLAGPAQKKARPVNLAEHLLAEVGNVKIISGRSSIQAILIDIGQTETDVKGKITKGGAAIFFAPELAAGIVQDDQAIQILTDIYDYKPTGHTTNLIGRGKVKLDKLIFSLLGASNAELLKAIYTEKAIHGGLLSRTFIITPNEYRPPNAFPENDNPGFIRLVNSLRELARLEGAIPFDGVARDCYQLWYDRYTKESRKKKDTGGVLGRVQTHVKKLSLILAMNDLKDKIEVHHVEQAINECLGLLPNYNVLTISNGKSTIAQCGEIVLQTLATCDGHYNRVLFLREHWMDFDAEVLDKTIAAFEAAKLIESVAIMSGNEAGVYYKLSKKGKETMGIEETTK